MKFIGHRGAKGERPENTLLGIEYALDCGLDGVEIDIHGSRDGVLTVIHDDTLDRTTNGRGAVKNHDFGDIQNLDAGNGQRVPRLEEVLELFASHPRKSELTLFIEVKALGLEEQLIKLIQSYREEFKIIVKSFNHRVLKSITHSDAQIPCACLIYGLPINPVQIAKNCGAQTISVSIHTFDKKLVSDCHEQGITVCAWNCNSAEQIEYFRKTGLDWLCTDFPSKVPGDRLR